jgi:hypothetical protein
MKILIAVRAGYIHSYSILTIIISNIVNYIRSFNQSDSLLNMLELKIYIPKLGLGCKFEL